VSRSVAIVVSEGRFRRLPAVVSCSSVPLA
jgi:hypothetical protein